MQASRKEALPLFGILEREEGERDRLRRYESPLRSQIWIFRPAWESAEHQGRPSN